MAKKKIVAVKKAGAKAATAADAQIVLHLFDQRRDETFRKARNFVAFEFAPRSEEEFLKTLTAFGTPEQTYWRMVSSYWEQAAALVKHGAVHAELFEEFAGELFFIYAKYRHFIPAARKAINPTAWSNIEYLANRTAANRERIERMARMQAERFAPRAAKTGS